MHGDVKFLVVLRKASYSFRETSVYSRMYYDITNLGHILISVRLFAVFSWPRHFLSFFKICDPVDIYICNLCKNKHLDLLYST